MTGKVRAVVVDDHDLFRGGLRELLEEQGISVVGEAADGIEGVEAAAELQPDVVLLDMSMPRMGGLQAIPKLRRQAPRTTIIGLSSHGAARMRGPAIAWC